MVLEESKQNKGHAIIVGGSLCGLAAAIALAHNDIEVTVLERTVNDRGGGGLGVDPFLLQQVTDGNPLKTLPMIKSYRYTTSWLMLRNWLAEQALRTGITLHKGVVARAITQSMDQVLIKTDKGDFSADIVIGADGYRSMVRAHVDPIRPDATYAGYMLWRGFIDERLLKGTRLPGPMLDLFEKGPWILVAYAVPGRDGSTTQGSRQLMWGWYDPTQTELLEQLGCIEDNRVRHTLLSEEIPATVKKEITARAAVLWPSPWKEAILTTFQAGDPFVTPIAEYRSERLVRDRVAILGDAAHVVTPMTGSGYATGLRDIQSLAHRTRDGIRGSQGPLALQAYQHDRLRDAQRLFAASRNWSRDYLRYIY
jgi:2-polyprenyl-6-methoxyphenol hydroxylase-like FAD-dependent oxidoreductase